MGKLAEWIEEEGRKFETSMELGEFERTSDDGSDRAGLPPSPLEPFEVTLDSILILPHLEVLDARIEALEERMPQTTLGETLEEKEYRKKKERGLMLIEEEIKKGQERKKEREKKRMKERVRKLKKELKELELMGDEEGVEEIKGEMRTIKETLERGELLNTDIDTGDDCSASDDNEDPNNNRYNGPCVIYLSPNEESRIGLESLRETLRSELFPMYDGFSPSSSVSPYPEHLPRKTNTQGSGGANPSASYRPLLPIARFPTVSSAVKIAKVLQKVWEPLTFNVTDIQFVSRNDDDLVFPDASTSTPRGTGFGISGKKDTDWDIPEVRHRSKHGTLSKDAAQRMAVTSGGEVEDISKRGIYGCDAMVMLWGEEPEEELMDEGASLSMLMGEDDDEEIEAEDGDNTSDTIFASKADGKINYDELFATAEREYQRMQSHEELSSASYIGSVPIFEGGDMDIEEWLDGEDDEEEDEGATVVIGRAQFFMGAMREFIG